MKILVVENSELMLDIFRNCFDEKEMENIDFASSFEEASEKIKENNYDKIIANLDPCDNTNIFKEAKDNDIERRIMITSSSKCCTNENATCGIRKPLTIKNIRKICLEDRESIKSLYGFIQQA